MKFLRVEAKRSPNDTSATLIELHEKEVKLILRLRGIKHGRAEVVIQDSIPVALLNIIERDNLV